MTEEEVKKVLKQLKERKRFFVALSKKAPGFAEGYANGLNEAIKDIENVVSPNEVDPEERQ